ncbi:hypothetical protein NONI108955_37205 [Nocardia ninae]|uniref:Uncharacterized protein n=1 Tax=Nocardia ninae NBRC 108245 TaxID=1210091 RepID=A0A511M7G6_9NOCA|nr:hypothetical protein NN4_11010 [Nocardia ninae NBRC 108245]
MYPGAHPRYLRKPYRRPRMTRNNMCRFGDPGQYLITATRHGGPPTAVYLTITRA